MGSAGRAAAPLLLAAAAALLVAGPAAGDDVLPPSILIEAPGPSTLYNESGGFGHPGRAHVVASVLVSDPDTVPFALNISYTLTPDLSEVAPGEGYNFTRQNAGTATVRATLEFWAPDGIYTLQWTVDDGAGHADSDATAFAVDLTSPRIEFTVPPPSRTPEVWVTIDITDETAGVALEDVQVLFRSQCNESWSPLTPYLTAIGGHVVGEVQVFLCEGANNTLQILAYDRGGLGNSTGLIQLMLDSEAPLFGAHRPASFTTADGPTVELSASVLDEVAGTNLSTVQFQVSKNGGVSWGPWANATVKVFGSYHVASANESFAPGTAAAVRWRAFDVLGNGPGEQVAVHFTVNGPPFLISFEPTEDARFLEGQEITFSARFADPDADHVRTTFYSDIDGFVGELTGRHEVDPSGDSFRRTLSLGTHNLTVVGEDGHGNKVAYTYTLSVVVRPPPDLRPFAAIPFMAAAMVAAAWLAWRRAEEWQREADEEN
jgi:hypothetical protein